MYLDKKEERMLAGDYGPAVELSMKAIVKVGDAVGAERLVQIASSHIGNAGFLSKWEAYVSVVKLLTKFGAKVEVPTSENPYPVDLREPLWLPEEFGVPEAFKELGPLDRYYRELGVTPTWTCTPYLYGNIPRFGQHVCWEESSAVVYANAVLGTRTNRETILMDLLAAIAGRTPYHGLHLTENRRGEILCTIKNAKLPAANYPVIGYYIGKIVGTKIPVLDGVPRDVSTDNLKNFGAAAASSGAVAHFHIPGVTPEARSLEDVFKGERPVDRIEIGPREIRETREEMSLLKEGETIDAVVIGCPHYSIKEVAKVAKMLDGKKMKENIQFLIYTHDGAKMLAKELGYSDIIEACGAKLVTGCPNLLFKVPPYDEMSFITDSGKICYYTNAAYGSLRDCVKSGVEGKVVSSEKW